MSDEGLINGIFGHTNFRRDPGSATASPRYVAVAKEAGGAGEDRIGRAREAFPGFEPAAPLPDGFEDFTLADDAAPNFRDRHLNLCFFADLEDPARRKGGPGTRRFRLYHMDGRGEPLLGMAPRAEAETWQDFAPALNEAMLTAHGWRIRETDDEHRAWARSLADGKQAWITGPGGDHRIGADDHILAVIFWPDGACIYTHAEDVSSAVTWVADNASTPPEDETPQ